MLRKSCHREIAPCFARLHRRRRDRSLGAAGEIRQFLDRDLVVAIRNLRTRPFLIGLTVQRPDHATGLRRYAFDFSSRSGGDVSGRIPPRRPLRESLAQPDASAVRNSRSRMKGHGWHPDECSSVGEAKLIPLPTVRLGAHSAPDLTLLVSCNQAMRKFRAVDPSHRDSTRRREA